MEGMTNIKNKIRFCKKEMLCPCALFGAVFLLAINFVLTTLNNNFSYQNNSIL